jgi:hypothetical protein
VDTDQLSTSARRVWRALEPIAANVYFAPEAHTAYESLGFGPSPGERNGVAFPDGTAYFTSRGACLGTVPGEVVAAAFGVFNPAAVVPAVAEGWRRTTREAILAARQNGAVESLQRLLGEPPGLARATALLQRGADAVGGEGRALFSGLRSLGWPGDPMGDFWRAADLVREHRGDSHIAAWVGRDLDGVEIGLLTDLWRGLPFKSWVRSRAWSDDDLEAGAERLRRRGLLDGDALTDRGRDLREEIEVDTDRLVGRVIAALGEDLDELVGLVEPWRDAVVEGGGYPRAT